MISSVGSGLLGRCGVSIDVGVQPIRRGSGPRLFRFVRHGFFVAYQTSTNEGYGGFQ
jgi:hypothetical protein